MRHARALLALATVTGLAVASSTASAADWNDEDYRERDEIRQTVELAPGAEVRVSDISGPVEIVTGGAGQAEILVVRSAPSKEQLEHRKIAVEHTGSSLAVYTVREPGWRGGDRVQQRVTLRVPRQVNLTVNDVAGQVRIGEIDGAVRVSDVAGRLEIERVNGTPTISDIAGSVRLTVGQIGEEGMNVNDVAGRVEVGVAPGLDADVLVQDVTGSIDMGVPAVALGKQSRERYEGRIGRGGARITIADIAGAVSFRPAE